MKNAPKYKHGFQTPKDYFENFDERLFDKIQLGEVSGASGFKVPKGYFNSLEDRILEKIANDQDLKVKSLFHKRWYYYVGSIAACVAFLFLFNIEKPSTVESLELVDIENYMYLQGSSLDSYDLAQYISTEQLDSLNLQTELFSEINLETYLLDALDNNTLLIE